MDHRIVHTVYIYTYIYTYPNFGLVVYQLACLLTFIPDIWWTQQSVESI